MQTRKLFLYNILIIIKSFPFQRFYEYFTKRNREKELMKCNSLEQNNTFFLIKRI